MADRHAGLSKVLFLGRRSGESDLGESVRRVIDKRAEVVFQTPESHDEAACVIVDLNDTGLEEPGSAQRRLVDEVLLKWEKLPHVLLLGAERRGMTEYNRDYGPLGRLSEIQLFTELCPEYHSFLPLPCLSADIANLVTACRDQVVRDNPFLGFASAVSDCGSLAGDVAKWLGKLSVQDSRSGGKSRATTPWAEAHGRELRHAAGQLASKSTSNGRVVTVFEKATTIFGTAGEYTLPAVVESKKRDESHGRIDFHIQLYSLLIGLVRHKKRLALTGEGCVNVCLIEDNLEDSRLYLHRFRLEELLTGYVGQDRVRFWQWDGGHLRSLKATLESELADAGGAQPAVFVPPKPVSSNGDGSLASFDDIDCVVVDLLLKDGVRYYNGIDFVRLLTNTHPEVPVIVLSKSTDACDLKRSFGGGASYYILKERVLTLLDHYYDYLDELGKLVWLIRDEGLRRNLLGNLRYWHFKRDLLWFGNKCYHIVDHAFNHMSNVWNITQQVVYPLLTRPGARYEDDDLYAFCAAVWLHDIGHKGNARYGVPHEVRDAHPLLSAELILQNQLDYRIPLQHSADRGSNPYSYPAFTRERSGIARLRERIAERGTLTLVEKVALLVAFHKDNCPILNSESLELGRIPLDYFEGGSRSGQLNTLESIVGTDSNLLKYAALLRFIDGLDISRYRVGDRNERGERRRVVERDLAFHFRALRSEVERLVIAIQLRPGKSEEFRRLFFTNVRDAILTRQHVPSDVRREQDSFLHGLDEHPDLETYLQLVKHCCYLSVQTGHFDLHASIDRLEIGFLPGAAPRLHVRYHSNRSRAELLDSSVVGVKEYWEPEAKSIAAHLLGFKSKDKDHPGYVMDKLKKSERILSEHWFTLDADDIVLHSSDEEELRRGDVTEHLQATSRP